MIWGLREVMEQEPARLTKEQCPYLPVDMEGEKGELVTLEPGHLVLVGCTSRGR